jgi:hypothetical protein
VKSYKRLFLPSTVASSDSEEAKMNHRQCGALVALSAPVLSQTPIFVTRRQKQSILAKFEPTPPPPTRHSKRQPNGAPLSIKSS